MRSAESGLLVQAYNLSSCSTWEDEAGDLQA